ncbi:MAG: tRNA (guanine-N1)-methyltransferase [Desulfitibacter sp. BRH_c19]|nr:MAG: tRNA (guanine-N1)-methyltransferase [Desulfitibacter sp. BRH_c19]
MRIDVITIFPEMVDFPLNMSIIGKAREKGVLDLFVHNLREYSGNKHYSVDDTPYGGGPGMVMKAEPFFNAINSLDIDKADSRVILMSPQGTTFNQDKAKKLSRLNRITILCGHYEGIDERVRELLVDEEISIGDYILTGGELGAMVLIDAVTRLLPDVLGHEESIIEESFSDGLLEYPHYTKPREFQGLKVPEVLLSGNHAKIDLWRRKQSILRTLRKRPDLLNNASFSKADQELLAKLRKDEE